MNDFKSMLSWRLGHELAMAIYRATATFPREELYGITSQVRKAGLSVPTNLAEGAGRMSPREFRRFVGIACGSSKEVEYHLLAAHELGFLPDDDYQFLSQRLDRLQRVLAGLYRSIKT